MNRLLLFVILSFILIISCQQKELHGSTLSESSAAKAMLQGIWIDEETEEVSFCAKGDTLFFSDAVSLPSYFCIVGDSLFVGDKHYAILKQSEHSFWFVNQLGDVIKLTKSSDDIHELNFEHKMTDVNTQYPDVLKYDSVVVYKGKRYHWYIAINPTRYRITSSVYTEDGMEAEQVYYDNIIHLSVYNDATCKFSSDIKKQQFSKSIPSDFLEQAVLGELHYDYIDDKGIHFVAKVCIPNEAACYEESIDVVL